MSEIEKIRAALLGHGWFQREGAYVSVDGQFGSTGKGVINGLLAELFPGYVDYNISNAAPNSGHTTIVGDRKVVLKQLPTFGVVEKLTNQSPLTNLSTICLSNGAVIDFDLLTKECEEYGVAVWWGNNHARIYPEDKKEDQKTVGSIASTGQGVGPALVRKLQRQYKPDKNTDGWQDWNWLQKTLFLEVSQGFSLGINSGFYPYVTSRECTVSQALSDAGLPPQAFRQTLMSVRTFPIRVGNSPEGGYSGPCYSDQKEIKWEDIGVEPEYTTVTGRERRIFTWSAKQYERALLSNYPSVIFVNFCNYLQPGEVEDWVFVNVVRPYKWIFNSRPLVLMGFGPKSSDVYLWSN